MGSLEREAREMKQTERGRETEIGEERERGRLKEEEERSI